MGTFRANEVDNYGGQGGGGYFSLKNDKDVARVRFMYRGIEDVEGYAVHEISVDDKKRYVNCLRSYNEPLEKCPFCAAKQFQTAKLFIPLYNIDTDRVEVWERGKKFFGKMSGICARYPDTVSHIFEIERNGKKGDTGTTYEIYEVDKDNTTLEDLPELPKILGGIVLDKSAEEMNDFLRTGSFSNTDTDISRRRSEAREDAGTEERNYSRRRTPATNRHEDVY